MKSQRAKKQTDILVVEDNIDCLLYVVYGLDMLGYSFVTAQCAEPALRLAKKHLPNLILLDIALPGQSGLDLVKKLKHNPFTKAIPIIVVSALEPMTLQKMTIAAGCNDYLEKPYMLEELKQKIDFYLSMPVAS